MAVGHGMFGGSISLTGAVFLSRLPDLFGDLEGHHQDIVIHSLFPHFSQMLVTGADVVLYNCLVAMCDRIGQWELAAFLAMSGCQTASLVRKS